MRTRLVEEGDEETQSGTHAENGWKGFYKQDEIWEGTWLMLDCRQGSRSILKEMRSFSLRNRVRQAQDQNHVGRDFHVGNNKTRCFFAFAFAEENSQRQLYWMARNDSRRFSPTFSYTASEQAQDKLFTPQGRIVSIALVV
jgi:hypothetical protein